MVESNNTYGEEIAEKFVTTDPALFLNRFGQSATYQEAYDGFFVGKNPAAAHEMWVKAFLESRNAADALLDYYSQTGEYQFDTTQVPELSAQALLEYCEYVKELRSKKAGRDTMLEDDVRRSILHLNAAKALVEEKITPSIRLGRMLARIVLVEKGIETIDDARGMR